MRSKCVVQGGLFVCAFLAFPNNQSTRNIIRACGEVFRYGAWNDHRTRRDVSSIFYWRGAAYIDDFSGCRQYYISAEHRFFFYAYAFNYDACEPIKQSSSTITGAVCNGSAPPFHRHH